MEQIFWDISFPTKTHNLESEAKNFDYCFNFPATATAHKHNEQNLETNYIANFKSRFLFQFARIDAKKEEEARKQQMPLEIDEWGEGRNNGNAAADEIALDNQQIKTDNMEVVEDKQTA